MTGNATFENTHPTIQLSDLGELKDNLDGGLSPYRQGRFGWLYNFTAVGHKRMGRFPYLLKVLKPLYGINAEERINDEFEREITALGRLSRIPGIPRIIWSGKVNIHGQPHPAFAYAKVEPAVTLATVQDRGFKEEAILFPATAQTLFDIAVRLLETLEGIHQAGIRHLDLHPSNILVSRQTSTDRATAPFDLDVWLIDFGKSAVPLDRTATDQLSSGMSEFMPQDQLRHLVSNNGRYASFVLKDLQSANWDLYAIGVCLRKTTDLFSFRTEERQHQDALLKLADILQKEGVDYNERLCAAREHARNWRNVVPKLNNIKVRTFVAAHATIEPLLVPVLDSFPVQRLRRVQQLALTQFLYPGATHTRFAHTLGVVDLADRYIQKINSASPASPVSSEDRLTCLAYALVHDVGHYPFAHYLEEIDIQTLGQAGALFHHERVGRAMYTRDADLPAVFDDGLRKALEYVIPGFKDETFDLCLGSESNRSYLGQIVDGPIDADKLDYLVRDGNACGISYANGIDVERLLDAICTIGNGGNRHLAISIKGLASSSELYYTRFHMYSEVYYHKVSRFIAAAIKRAFLRVVDHRKPDSTRLIQTLLSSNEFQVVDYLLEKLREIDDGRYIAMLDDPFGRHGRRLFKRVRTYSNIWLQDANRATEHGVLTKLLFIAKSFRNLGDLETHISDAMDAICLLSHGKRACVLIDVPPPKEINKFPFVVDARATSYLNNVSPIVSSVADAQKRSQRVRIFASRDTYDALLKKFKSTPTVDQYIDNLILEYKSALNKSHN